MVPQAQPGKRGRGKRKVESSPQLAELLGLHSPCPAEGLLWIQPIKHQHFSSFSFCLFPHRCFGSAAPVGPARAAVLSGLELPKPCANSSHGGVTGGGNLQSQSAGNSSRMAGDKSPSAHLLLADFIPVAAPCAPWR